MGGRGYDAVMRSPPARLRWFGPASVALIVFVFAGCAGSSGGAGATPSAQATAPSAQVTAPFIPSVISSEAVVGRNRFLFGILDAPARRRSPAPTSR